MALVVPELLLVVLGLTLSYRMRLETSVQTLVRFVGFVPLFTMVLWLLIFFRMIPNWQVMFTMLGIAVILRLSAAVASLILIRKLITVRKWTVLGLLGLMLMLTVALLGWMFFTMYMVFIYSNGG